MVKAADRAKDPARSSVWLENRAPAAGAARPVSTGTGSWPPRSGCSTRRA